jgi:glycosyltransferase involved in cell wall biosynthesis
MERRLHVMLLTEDFLPSDELVGGVRISVHHQVVGLSRHVRLTILAPVVVLPPLGRYSTGRTMAEKNASARVEARDPEGVRVLRPRYWHVPVLHPVTQPIQLALLGLFAMWRHARDVDLLHAHRLHPMGMAAALLGWLARRPVVVTAHGSDLHTQVLRGKPGVRGWSRFVLARADCVITVSRQLEESARGLGVPGTRVRFIPNGVDAGRFAVGDRRAARARRGLPERTPVLLCTGFLTAVKGHAVLLEAMAILVGRLPEALLLVAGDGPLREALERQAAEAGIAGRVRFLGRVPYADIPELLAASDVAVLPSWNEGTPLTALEALASGRPLVGTAVGGTAEVVEHGRHGLLVAAGDPASLAGALEAALAREWDPEVLRARAHEYSWDAIVEQVLAVYKGLVPDRRG